MAGVTHSGYMGISSSTDPAVLSTGTYPATTRVDGVLSIDSNPGLTTLDGGFPRLTRIEMDLYIGNNRNLVTLGNAFPVLVEPGTSGGRGVSLYVQSNLALQSLGTAFASLRRIPGTLYVINNPLLTDWEALRNLECHGGAYQNNPALYCVGCHAWLLAKPQLAMLKRKHIDRQAHWHPGCQPDVNKPHRTHFAGVPTHTQPPSKTPTGVCVI